MRRKFALGCGLVAKRRAFTLVEMMVSMTVLVLLGVIVTQILSSTTSTTTGAEKQIEANVQARLIFDRMSSDFGAIAKNGSVNFLFLSEEGNDAFYFFSEATGYFSGDAALAASTANSFSLVGYRVSDQVSNEKRFELERMGRGLHWDNSGTPSGVVNGPGTSLVYLPATIASEFGNALVDPYNNSSNLRPTSAADEVPQWDVIGNLVFRMEFCFMLKDGTLTDIPVLEPTGLLHRLDAAAAPVATDDSGSGYAPGSRWYNKTEGVAYICSSATTGEAVWSPLGWQDVQAVVVAIAVMDLRNRQIAPEGSLKKLAAELPDFDTGKVDAATDQPTLMATTWSAILDKGETAGTVGLPQIALAGVRVYQQYFYLN